MRYIYLFSFIISLNLGYAKSVKCEFEEVYQDGSIQSGLMLFNDGLLRYQYNDKQLFTIIFNKNYFVINNNNKNAVSKLKDDSILNELKLIINNYPKIKRVYSKDEIEIKLFDSKEHKFLKRVSINSPNVNLSIYFINCNYEFISSRYFQPLLLPDIK